MNKARIFWPLAAAIVLLDVITKRMALGALSGGGSKEVFGDYLRFTLGFNPGIAFGIGQTSAARPLLIVFTMAAVGGILWIYRTTPAEQRMQIVALGLILGGAVGNLLDRFQRAAGVVDFIDVGLGATRFWTFNVADSAITIGAILLILGSLLPARKQPETSFTRSG